MQDLIEYLKNFNSKERFFLVGQILGIPHPALAPEFLKKLSDLLKIQIPADSLWAMDYHIDWLHASLKLSKDGDLNKIYSNKDNVIKAQQEDIDWLIAFSNQSAYHLILIEAKGVTGWSNSQLFSKARRLCDIFGNDGGNWPAVTPHFVIMSPSRPQHLSTEQCAKWMAPHGHFHWLELSIPVNLRRVCRCDETGRVSKDGESWKGTER